MGVFELLKQYDYGELHLHRDKAANLRAIIAVHETTLGPALGGCRFIEYSDETSAIVDALRLARGMTYKAAVAGISHGGGKAVIMKPSGSFSRTDLFRSFGQFIDTLGGHYITAEDSGTSVEDMAVIGTATRYVTGKAPSDGGGGDPSPFMALGVRRGIEACVKYVSAADSLEGVHVAVQGVGHVGYHLCRELHEQGAKLTVADVDALKTERAQREFGAEIANLDDIFSIECDVFAPCALGSALNSKTIPQLRAKIVAGAANNQLAEDSMAEDLMARDIIYAPDYVINAGGLIHVAQEYAGYDRDKVVKRTHKIFDTVLEIIERAKKTETTTALVASKMAEERLAAAGKR